MGLSASQARFLFLTARKTNLEFEAQQISQARAMLAQHTESVALAYEKAMANRALYYNSYNYKTQSYEPVRLSYDLITRSKYPPASDPTAATGLGCRLVDAWGKIVVPEFPTKEEMEKTGLDAPDYHIDANLLQVDYLEARLRDGTYTLQEAQIQTTEEGYWDDSLPYTWSESKSIGSFSCINDKLYTEDDAAAEAEYTAQTAEIQQQDKTLELRLTQIQTEQKEVETEMEGVSSLIKKETEVFKTTFNA